MNTSKHELIHRTLMHWIKALFSRIWKLIPHPGPTDKDDRRKRAEFEGEYDWYRNSLIQRRKCAEFERECLKSTSTDWYCINSVTEVSDKEIPIYVPYNLGKIVSLRFLKEERLRKERLAALTIKTNANLSEVESDVKKEKLQDAETLLQKIAVSIPEIRDSHTVQRYKDVRGKVERLRNILEGRKQKKLAEERKAKEMDINFTGKRYSPKSFFKEGQEVHYIEYTSKQGNVVHALVDGETDALLAYVGESARDAAASRHIGKCMLAEYVDEDGELAYVLTKGSHTAKNVVIALEDDEEDRKRREREERERLEKEERERLQSLYSQKKADAEEIKDILLSNKIRCFYHFTDIRNIQSIKDYGGLYSWDYCDSHSIKIPSPGGGDLSRNLDKRYNLQDYVRLSFCSAHPMKFVAEIEGRITNPILLEIDIDVALLEGTLFSDMNATKNGFHMGKSADDLKRVKFDIVRLPNHFKLDSSEKPYYQAEVLVKTWIPIKYIKNL